MAETGQVSGRGGRGGGRGKHGGRPSGRGSGRSPAHSRRSSGAGPGGDAGRASVGGDQRRGRPGHAAPSMSGTPAASTQPAIVTPSPGPRDRAGSGRSGGRGGGGRHRGGRGRGGGGGRGGGRGARGAQRPHPDGPVRMADSPLPSEGAARVGRGVSPPQPPTRVVAEASLSHHGSGGGRRDVAQRGGRGRGGRHGRNAGGRSGNGNGTGRDSGAKMEPQAPGAGGNRYRAGSTSGRRRGGGRGREPHPGRPTQRSRASHRGPVRGGARQPAREAAEGDPGKVPTFSPVKPVGRGDTPSPVPEGALSVPAISHAGASPATSAAGLATTERRAAVTATSKATAPESKIEASAASADSLTGSVGDDGRPILFVVEVDIGDGRSGEVVVRAGDTIADAARSVCLKYPTGDPASIQKQLLGNPYVMKLISRAREQVAAAQMAAAAQQRAMMFQAGLQAQAMAQAQFHAQAYGYQIAPAMLAAPAPDGVASMGYGMASYAPTLVADPMMMSMAPGVALTGAVAPYATAIPAFVAGGSPGMDGKSEEAAASSPASTVATTVSAVDVPATPSGKAATAHRRSPSGPVDQPNPPVKQRGDDRGGKATVSDAVTETPTRTTGAAVATKKSA